jgi:hypothetical protein
MDLSVSSDMIHHKLSHINLFFEAIKKARLFDRAAQSDLGLASSRRFDFHIELPLQASLHLTGCLVSNAFKLLP